jgi:hypothetical protein
VALTRAKFSVLSPSPPYYIFAPACCEDPIRFYRLPDARLILTFSTGSTQLCFVSLVPLYLYRFSRAASLVTLMMEGVHTFETLANSYQSTGRYNPEDSYLIIDFCFRRFLQFSQKNTGVVLCYVFDDHFLSHVPN